MKTIRKHLLVAVALFGLLVSAALAGGAAAGGARPASAPPTTATYSFAASWAGPTTGPPPTTTPPTTSVTGHGQVDFATSAASLTLVLPAGILPGVPVAFPVQLIYTGGTIYVSALPLTVLVGAPWASITLPASAVPAVMKGFAFAAHVVGDVPGDLAVARKAGLTVKSLGKQTVNGVPAKGYEVDITLPALLAHLPGTSAVPGHLTGRSGGTTIPLQVWEDHQGQLVQASVAVTGVTPGATLPGGPGLSASLDLSGYGAPVNIAAPPASETKPLPAALLKLLLAFLKSLLGGVSPAHLGHAA